MKKSLKILLIINGTLLFVFCINALLFNGQLNNWGIYPRNIQGLWGVIFAPFLHGNSTHLLNNLVGLSLFSALTLWHSPTYYWRASAIIILLGGIGVWLFGRPSLHIGASGWIFGLWAINIANPWYNRSIKTFFIAAIVILVWGTMVFGVLPQQPHTSFEAHLFGAIAGVIAAATLRLRKKR